MNVLEKLHDRNRMVGVSSYVRELKERLPRYLEVVAVGEDGSRSEIKSVLNLDRLRNLSDFYKSVKFFRGDIK